MPHAGGRDVAAELERLGEEGMAAGAVAGAEAAADGMHVFSDEDAWDVVEEIPDDSAAALVLLEALQSAGSPS